MTSEERAFQEALDANPEDHTLRLVFADWLDEQDPPDPRGPGYRALGVLKRRPERYSGLFRWTHWGRANLLDSILTRGSRACLVYDWWEKCEVHNGDGRPRRDCDDAAALAFSKLPESRRAELLAGVPV